MKYASMTGFLLFDVCLACVSVIKRMYARMKKKLFCYLLKISDLIKVVKSFLKNNARNVWRFRKKPYLCIAFETEV